MKYLIPATAALISSPVLAGPNPNPNPRTGPVTQRDSSTNTGCAESGGNWYCSAVSAITYEGVGGTGTYNRVTNMDSSSGDCSNAPFRYSGSMSPLNEEVSFHFRGPLRLVQFGAYVPANDGNSGQVKRAPHERGHAKRHVHHARDAKIGGMVTATIDGVAPTWTNEYGGSTGAPVAEDMVTATIDGVVVSWHNNYFGAAISSPLSVASPAASYSTSNASGRPTTTSSAAFSASDASSSSSSDSSGPAPSGSWQRMAHYSSQAGAASGLVFLNHEGGQGSGVFDWKFGASLAYASADGTGGSDQPNTLKDTTLPSTAEVVIFTNKTCTDSSCGYTRPGTVAYHGFDGAEKAFFFEFEMPNTGETTAANAYEPVNMPAIWLLNAQIPHTLQYGQANCSCWTSGCGEFDLFEVLTPGDSRMKSTYHSNNSGGDSNYFDRPENGTMKAAMILSNNNIHLKVLSDGTEWGDVLSAQTVSQLCEESMATNAPGVSLFRLSGHSG